MYKRQYQHDAVKIKVVKKELTVPKVTQYYYEVKPKKTYDSWMDCGTDTYIMLFKDTFDFIKWDDEPLSVNKILNNCEVVEDENSQ